MHTRAAVIILLIFITQAGGCLAPNQSKKFAAAAVASDHALASQAGAAMLARGGNAVDAAVAAAFTLSVVRPQSCGIGGGGFMLIHLRDKETQDWVSVALDYRETAPACTGPDFFEHLPRDAATYGGAAVAVPGSVAGLLHALETYGSLDRSAVLAPAIGAARNGFPADDEYIRVARNTAAWIEESDERSERFHALHAGLLRAGRVAPGAIITNPDQARVLERIARLGADGFYRGPTADAIVAAVAASGGCLTHDDLAGYRPRTLAPLVGRFRGNAVLSMPPPSSGGIALLQILSTLDQIPWASPGAPDVDRAHALAESMKHAFADRARHLADPDFAAVPVPRLLDPRMLSLRAASIDRHHTAAPDHYGAPDIPPLPDDSGTSHICAVDRWGGAVACTETVNLSFGSRVVADGIVLNDQMDDFTTRRGEPNAFGLRQSDANLPEPGKRPLSSMSPTIVLDGPSPLGSGVFMVAGASGGPRIITATTQAIINVIDLNMPADRAVAAGRIHHQWAPDRILVDDPRIPIRGVRSGSRLSSELRARGHTVEHVTSLAGCNVIVREGAGWRAACDPRRVGRPAGN